MAKTLACIARNFYKSSCKFNQRKQNSATNRKMWPTRLAYFWFIYRDDVYLKLCWSYNQQKRVRTQSKSR